MVVEVAWSDWELGVGGIPKWRWEGHLGTRSLS